LVEQYKLDFRRKFFLSCEQKNEERNRGRRRAGAEIDHAKRAGLLRLRERSIDRLRMELEKRDEFRRLKRKEVEEVARSVFFVCEIVLEIFRTRISEKIRKLANAFEKEFSVLGGERFSLPAFARGVAILYPPFRKREVPQTFRSVLRPSVCR
jgi:hypothetical protein